jgi:hypothetical protein
MNGSPPQHQSPASGAGTSDGAPQGLSPASGGGGWGDASDGRILPAASSSPDLLPQGGEADGTAPETPSPEDEFDRRDRLWRAGLLGGRELIDHVDEKRRRGQYVNGLQRGVRTVYVPAGSL